jgi:transposase
MVYGTIRDAKIIPAAVMEASISYAIVVVDKGFYSEKNKKILESQNLDQAIPMKDNNSLTNYGCLTG